ncbi:SpoIIIAH-like family protein [Priestia koreensis]|uniref:SpoIIIAH-like family protein n=1 Tax=Priestia koreensis TaxID=284581 RepID=UPI001F5A0BD0|nr:SpoIIIAH-like family protein [Priestia koreensis]MCM3002426.1 SpoIIIAH-like family protein [Priestia koreensis]
MLLKKQTVWLLTMLSLVVVLSVYYITSPENPKDNVAFVDKKEEQKNAKEKSAKASDKKEKATAEVSTVDTNDMFTALRLNIEDERSKLMEQYNDVVASSDYTPEEKSKAKDQLEELAKLSEKEGFLEDMIKSNGYKDALVRTEGGQVKVTVSSKKKSPEQANKIMQLVEKELGNKLVSVEFQPASSK